MPNAAGARPSTPPAAAEEGREYLVNSLVRGLELLQLFTRHQPSLSLPEVAEQSGLNRTTAYRFLYTLRRLGYLDFEPDRRRYRLGPRVLQLGFDYLNSLPLVERVQPFLRALREEVGESTHLGILDDTVVVYVARVPGQSIVSASVSVGSRLPAHLTAMGRVLLANLPEERLDAILARIDFSPHTPYSIGNREALRKTLQTVHEQGYANTEQEFELGVCSVAAPIRDASGAVVAAVNASGPATRFTREAVRRRIVPAVQRRAAEASTALGCLDRPLPHVVASSMRGNGAAAKRRPRNGQTDERAPGLTGATSSARGVGRGAG